ncbi:TonB-dependent siderophore receptor [Pseudoroseomonas sp. WGS1072]|uniref:TonB-dependent siderophore receptor n=1 Tax=Roseomonas sp. WGS1072 TaxID=3366816 RepID=UPI003BF31048
MTCGRAASLRRSVSLLALATGLAGGPLTASAQSPAAPAPNAVQLPEVNVQAGVERGYSPVQGFVAGVSATATKTDTPLIETPQSISVITADEIRARDAQNINQIMRYSVGAVTETRGSAAVRLDQMTIRGYSPSQYLDGMRLAGGRDANPSLDAYRLERLEVLRGPASVLYGTTPPGGIINAVSKRPTEERIREVLLQAGTREHWRVAGDYGGKLDENGEWLGRFIGSYAEGNGELDEVRERRYFFSPSLTWRPTSNTTITVLGHYQRDPESGSYGGVPGWGSALPNPNGRIATRFYDGDWDFERSNREHYQIGYLAEHRFNDTLTVRQNFRYMHTQGEYRSLYGSAISSDMTQLIRSVFGTDADLDVFNLDNQVQAKFDTGPARHTLLAGLDYFRVLNDVYTGSNVYNGRTPNGVLRQSLFNPVYANQNTRWPGFATYSSQRQNQLGVYLQDQVRIGQLVLMAGGRIDWSDSTTENRRAGSFALTGTSRQTDSAFTGRAGAVYLFENGLAPYVSYSESFEPQTGTDRNLNPFDPTTGRQYEIGLRYQPPGTNLSIAVAAFDLLRENVLSTDPVNPQFSVQNGEVRTRGFELEAKATLAQGLSLTAAYSYLDMEYTKSNNSVGIDYGIEGRASGGTVRQEGKVPTGIPRHNASAWLDYTAPEGRFGGLGVAGGVRYLGSSWGDPANTFKVDSATLFDAALRYDLGQVSRDLNGMQLAVNIQNVADTRYVASCLSYAWCWYGYGRTVTGSLRYRF